MPFSSCVGICSKRTPLKVFPTKLFHSGGYNLDTKPWLLLSGEVSFDSNFLCFHMTTVYCTFLPLGVNYGSFFIIFFIFSFCSFTSHFKARCCSNKPPTDSQGRGAALGQCLPRIETATIVTAQIFENESQTPSQV